MEANLAGAGSPWEAQGQSAGALLVRPYCPPGACGLEPLELRAKLQGGKGGRWSFLPEVLLAFKRCGRRPWAPAPLSEPFSSLFPQN